GVLDRLGLGGAEMLARNPRLVYCALTGFGQDGPWKERAAYDHIVQAVGGMMNYTGGDGPALSGVPIVDVFSGLMAAFAIAGALVERGRTGKGRIVDVSMLETLIYLLGYYAVGAIATGENPAPLGNSGTRGRPGSGTFETADGHLVLTVFMPGHRIKLCEAMGREDLLDEMSAEIVEFDLDTAARLRAELQRTLRGKSAAEWEEILAGRGLGGAEMLARNPRLVYCALTGFGQERGQGARHGRGAGPSPGSVPPISGAFRRDSGHRRARHGPARPRLYPRRRAPAQRHAAPLPGRRYGRSAARSRLWGERDRGPSAGGRRQDGGNGLIRRGR
ncbi:MAG: CoA transferase, partial [Alphaproteobacteria bacterium]